jgi:SpoVK/Ycf46/Vps4 family AAA+-type ATPase
MGEDIFKENGELSLPTKVYTSKKDEFFKKRVLTYFNNAFTDTTGVMLAGTKGTGKTIMAKVLAKESNLPIIIVDSEYPEYRLIKYFKQISTPVCILFDEVDKSFDTEKMLDFLDGLQKTSKKLVIMTCNNLHKVSEYLQDRCSRIRYLRKYTTEDNLEFLDVLIEDMGIKNVEEVSKFCRENIKLLSMDNIVAFLNEVKMLEDEDITLEEIISVMNIDHVQPKGEISEEESIDNEEDDEYDDEDDEMDFAEPWDEECCCAA